MFGNMRRHMSVRNAGIITCVVGAGSFASNTISANRWENKMHGCKSTQYSAPFAKLDSALMLTLSSVVSKSLISVTECHATGDSCCKESTTAVAAPIAEKSSTALNTVVEITTESFEEIVLKSDKDVFVVFYAPWCGYCKRLVPVWKELAEECKDTSSVVIAQMDMTQHRVTAPGITIHGYPTIYLFKAGRKEAPIEYRGARDVASFTAFLEFYTNM